MSEMANIGRHGLMGLDWGLLRETRDGLGGRVSQHHNGGRLAAGTVRGDLGGSHVIGGTYGGLASGGIRY